MSINAIRVRRPWLQGKAFALRKRGAWIETGVSVYVGETPTTFRPPETGGVD